MHAIKPWSKKRRKAPGYTFGNGLKKEKDGRADRKRRLHAAKMDKASILRSGADGAPFAVPLPAETIAGKHSAFVTILAL